MTRGEIKTWVQSILDDPSGTYFTDSVVNTWINLAQRQCQMQLLQAGENYYMRPVETLTVANQADYVLPSDFFVEHRLEVVLSGTGVNENRQPLIPITTNQQDLFTLSVGQPTNYFIKKDRVTLTPIPDNEYTLRLYYSPLIVDLSSDSDVPDIPEQYMEYLCVLAAYNGFVKDDRAPASLSAKLMQFETLLKQMAEDRTQDRSRQVVMTSNYDDFGGMY